MREGPTLVGGWGANSLGVNSRFSVGRHKDRISPQCILTKLSLIVRAR
jgi:hypothetical protein